MARGENARSCGVVMNEGIESLWSSLVGGVGAKGGVGGVVVMEEEDGRLESFTGKEEYEEEEDDDEEEDEEEEHALVVVVIADGENNEELVLECEDNNVRDDCRNHDVTFGLSI